MALERFSLLANTSSSSSPDKVGPVVSAAHAEEPFDANALLARVWQQNAHIMTARRDQLTAAAAAAAAGTLTPEMRAEARDIAHKMAGSLGMFGYHEGTTAAQKLEVLLEGSGEPDAPELVRLAAALRDAMPA